jgi:hypothetical protein
MDPYDLAFRSSFGEHVGAPDLSSRTLARHERSHDCAHCSDLRVYQCILNQTLELYITELGVPFCKNDSARRPMFGVRSFSVHSHVSIGAATTCTCVYPQEAQIISNATCRDRLGHVGHPSMDRQTHNNS